MNKKVETTDAEIRCRSYVNEHPCCPSNNPGTCLWCGRKLRRKCRTEKTPSGSYAPPEWACCTGESWRRVEDSDSIFECTGCDNTRNGRKRYRHKRTPYFEGGARGDYGDNAFCGLRCGYSFGVAMAGFGRRLEPQRKDTP